MADPAPAIPEIFDSGRRAQRRARADRIGGGFLAQLLADELSERIADIDRPLSRALVMGGAAPQLRPALETRFTEVVQGDDASPNEFAKDALPFDIVLWAGGLESTSDVPGVLARCRKALKPDGVIVGAFYGGGSLATLRSVMRAADGDAPRQRLHPQVEVRSMGDLLQRAGFAMPVVDADGFTLRYQRLLAIASDLRTAALTNVLSGSVAPLGKAEFARALATFDALRGADGRVDERFTLIHFTGWAPDPSQPKPAARGSSTVSLADALQSPRARTWTKG